LFCIGLSFSNAKVRDFIYSDWLNLIYLNCSLKVYKNKAPLFSVFLPNMESSILLLVSRHFYTPEEDLFLEEFHGYDYQNS
jgi:hypothetical protein